jgi:hypothetical protein
LVNGGTVSKRKSVRNSSSRRESLTIASGSFNALRATISASTTACTPSNGSAK